MCERRARYPGMRVYHYAAYERTALTRLMGEHGTREPGRPGDELAVGRDEALGDPPDQIDDPPLPLGVHRPSLLQTR